MEPITNIFSCEGTYTLATKSTSTVKICDPKSIAIAQPIEYLSHTIITNLAESQGKDLALFDETSTFLSPSISN